MFLFYSVLLFATFYSICLNVFFIYIIWCKTLWVTLYVWKVVIIIVTIIFKVYELWFKKGKENELYIKMVCTL